jgi:histidinol phosphatase-like enzyme (inositol monophosphatase family)
MLPELPPPLSSIENGRFGTAVRMAISAGRSTLRYFRTNTLQVERKSDASPVTIADKEAEQEIRRELEQRYPDDAILGEEFGEAGGETEYRWIIDPIDGTKSFISGVPLYSTLVAVTRHGKPSIGVIYIPALDEIVIAAVGHGAWYSQGSAAWTRARVSQQSELGQGLFVTSQVDTFDRRNARQAFDRISEAAYVTRTWGDGYGYLLVATGRAEVMVDPIVNPWDVAAVMPVIEEAGGRYTDWQGKPSIQTGNGIGSNGRVHDTVLAMLK